MKNHLHIRGLCLPVNLGWRDKERKQEQQILLDLELTFPKPPKACLTDHLKDTICYAVLIETLREELATRNFRLIEHLAYTIYDFIKGKLPLEIQISVQITKHPNIEGLTHGVSFSCSDEKR